MQHIISRYLHIVSLDKRHIDELVMSMKAINKPRSKAYYMTFIHQMRHNERRVFVALYKGAVAGYITVILHPGIGPFVGKNIPEIADFNVFPAFRKKGIGNALLDTAEAFAKSVSSYVSLAVGLPASYGPAQRIYIKRGYLPDGSGLWRNDHVMAVHETCDNQNELSLYLIKKLI